MKKIAIDELKLNPSVEIGKNWMLISSGTRDNFNMMTASWGEIGALWGKSLIGRPTCTIFVRPSRYTDKFIDENDIFTISFFPEQYKDDLLYLGSHSGKNENKLAKTKLTSDFSLGYVTYKEATLTFICKKIYKGKIDKEGFIDKSILKDFYSDNNIIYNNASFHNVYVGEILEVFVKD